MLSYGRAFSLSGAILVSFFGIMLTGCGVGTLSPASTTQSAIGAIQGSVYGGQQPIVGAKVYLYAASTTGYGGPGIAATSTNASTSLLNAPGYVTTGAGGTFSITGDYTCTAGTQVYLYSVGGQPTSGSVNSGAGLLAALGQCPTTGGNFSSTISYVFMNEVSTVAMAYAVAGFATDTTHIGAYSATNNTLAKANLATAFANANLIYNIQGGGSSRTVTPGTTSIGTVPSNIVNALANSLAGCIDSTGPTSTPCATDVFSTLSGGTSGSAPTDTATAAIYIAQNPGLNVPAIFGAASTTPPFNTSLGSAPNDWTIGITYSGGGIDSPSSVAIDASGNAWITNLASGPTINSGYGALTEITPSATFPSGTNGYIPTAGGSYKLTGVAIDKSGNAWAGSLYSGVYSEFVSSTNFTAHSATGTSTPGLAISGSGDIWFPAETGTSAYVFGLTSSGGLLGYFTSATLNLQGIAVDGAGHVWAGSTGTAAIEYSSTGAAVTNSPFSGLNQPESVAVDSAGNAWFANYGGNSVTRITNPISSGITSANYTGGGLSGPQSIVLDGAGNAWLANKTGNSITGLTSSGTDKSGSTGYTVGGTLSSPNGIAADGSGNLWVTNSGNNTVTEILGAAVPVLTPIVAGLPATATSGSSNLGTRP